MDGLDVLGARRLNLRPLFTRQAYMNAVASRVRCHARVVEHHRQHRDRLAHRFACLPLGDELTDERRNILGTDRIDRSTEEWCGAADRGTLISGRGLGYVDARRPPGFIRLFESRGCVGIDERPGTPVLSFASAWKSAVPA